MRSTRLELIRRLMNAADMIRDSMQNIEYPAKYPESENWKIEAGLADRQSEDSSNHGRGSTWLSNTPLGNEAHTLYIAAHELADKIDAFAEKVAKSKKTKD